jgi:hypothetical protein
MAAQLRRLQWVGDADDGGLELPRLLGEQLDVVAGGETDQLNAIRQITGDLARAGADRTGTAEEDDFLHFKNVALPYRWIICSTTATRDRHT